MIRTMICVAALLLSSGAAVAQPKYGDLLVGAIGGTTPYLFYVDRTTGNIFSLTTSVQQGGFTNAVLMAADNSDIIAIESGGNSSVLSVTPFGTATTLATIVGGSAGAGDLLQNGNYVFNTFNELVEVQPGTVNTLRGSITNSPNASARNPDNDNIILGMASGGFVQEWDPRTNTLTTICSGTGTMGGVDPMPRGWAGNPAVAVAQFGSPPKILVCSGGSVVNTVTNASTSGGGQALKVDDATGHIYVCTTGGSIYELDPATNTVVNMWTGYGMNFTGVELYGSRRVTGSGTGSPGSPYGIKMNFGQAGASEPVYVALSFGQRPGIAVPGGARINLALDQLFIDSVQGLLTGPILSGFPTTLDPFGRGGGTILIPGFVPSGFTFYFSAIAIAQQSIVLTANTIGIRT